MPAEHVDRFAIFEAAFHAAGRYENPYLEVDATAIGEGPHGRWEIPLFYDGGDVWRLRLAPHAVGRWRFRVRSSDAALNGQSGEFECIPSDRRGGLGIMEGYPYHFAYQDGTPVWLFGDTQWRAFATDPAKRLTRETFCHYVDVRAEQGFNYVHSDVMGGGGVDSRQPVFFDFAQERINPDFFREVDFRIAYMNDRGITAGLVLAWHRGPIAWEAFPSDTARLRYARYMVARYSAYNVVFIVSGEWDQIRPERKPVFQAIGREILRCDPHGRLRSIHPCQRRSVAEFAAEPWMSFGDYQQAYEAPHHREALPAERRALYYALLNSRVHRKPVVNAEYGYYLREMGDDHRYGPAVGGVDKPHSHTRDSFRRASWVLAMAGGYFVTGFGTTYFGGWRDRGPFDVDAAKNDDAEADLGHLKAFFTNLEWWRLEPAGHLVHAAEPGYAYCLAEPGSIYVIYSEGTVRVFLDTDEALSGTDAPTYAIERFDPRQGTCTPLPGRARGPRLQLVPPDTQDWAFVVRRE
ncbi:MAG TPA: DUF5060 domain-containing protein [Limnochordia bacterium]